MPRRRKACDYLGKNKKPCNMCCTFNVKEFVKHTGEKIKVPKGKPVSKADAETAQKLGIKLDEEHNFCGKSKEGKCKDYSPENPLVKNVCKGFECRTFRKFERIADTKFGRNMINQLAKEPSRKKRIKIVDDYFKLVRQKS